MPFYGEAGNDTLIGSDGNDLADGGVNDDLISGAAGDDTLIGADGNDTLSGGSGSDSLSGGSGNRPRWRRWLRHPLRRPRRRHPLRRLGSSIPSATQARTSSILRHHHRFRRWMVVTSLILQHFTPPTSPAQVILERIEFHLHPRLYPVQPKRHRHPRSIRPRRSQRIHGSTTVATLSGVDATTVLPDQLQPSAAATSSSSSKNNSAASQEDSGASIIYRAVLGKAPTANVTLDITGGDQITVNGAADSTSLTFSADNWWVPQDITVAAADDLLIEGNVPATIEHTFSSADTSFDGLSETLSVNVIDNDFQRSLETTKRPSGGNNHIIYDFTGTSADYTFTNNGTGYDLAAGNDKLEITGSYQSSLKNTWFGGNTGNDSISGATIADGGSGDDTLVTFSTGVSTIYRDGNRNSYDTSKVYVGEWTTTRLAGNTGNDSISAGNISLVAAGGSGSDSISGSTSNDILWGDGYESLNIRNDYFKPIGGAIYQMDILEQCE